MKRRLLDLYCKAGGAAMGYYRAGFEVVGVDIEPQPRYPFQFVQADALQYALSHGYEFDAIHASPPCQAHTALKNLFVNDNAYSDKHLDLIPHTRFVLETLGKPYIIENVVGAPLRNPLLLCGSMFEGLRVYRHRLFESNVLLLAPQHKPHKDKMQSLTVSPNGFMTVAGNGGIWGLPEGTTYMEYANQAMGIDWMNRKELSQAIPPAYTEYLGKQLIKYAE